MTSLADIKALPHSDEMEQAFLGALLINNQVYERAVEFLRPEHFFEAVHARIYEACGTLINRGTRADSVSLSRLFDQDGALASVGGHKYLMRLTGAVVTIINAADYARSIVDLAKRRELVVIAQGMEELAYSGSLDLSAETIIRDSEDLLYRLSKDTARGQGMATAKQSMDAALYLMEEAYKGNTRILGVSTGFPSLDKLILGLQGGLLYVVAGRPSMGKSTLADAIAENVARSFLAEAVKETRPPQLVGSFSLEMGHAQLAFRRLSRATGIELDLLRRGSIDQAQFDQAIREAEKLGELPSMTDDTARVSLPELRARARRLARSKGGLGALVVDHLGLITPPAEVMGNRNAEITEITMTLKALAKELNVPVIALSQLSRQLEGRDDKRPVLSDLRDSGSIEQDADVVIFVYREEYYLSRSVPVQRVGEHVDHFHTRKFEWEQRLSECANECDVIVAKQRDGAIGILKTYFDGARSILRSESARF